VGDIDVVEVFERSICRQFEAQRVIGLRVTKIVKGGSPALQQAQRMISGEVLASVEAATAIAGGEYSQRILRRHRTIMRAKIKRLSKSRS
jgi:hypothetical protein